MLHLEAIRGILCDLDGVVYTNGVPIPGAVESIQSWRESGRSIRFLTNTSTKPASEVLAFLNQLALPVQEQELFTATTAAKTFLTKHQYTACHGVMRDKVLQDFAEFLDQDTLHPDAVLIGDIGKKWNYQIMNRLFQMIINGADLIALHKGRFWKGQDQLILDIGAFVSGLEYATGKKATIIGKPNPNFFELAIQSLRLPKEQIVMIGDDIQSDIGGAKNVGLQTILVKSGKFKEGHSLSHQPDLILESIDNLHF